MALLTQDSTHSQEASRRTGLTASATNREIALYTMLAGILGGLFITVTMAIARGAGLITLNLERGFGALLIGQTGSGPWLLGLFLHLAFSALFALFYAEGFRLMHNANWKIGAAFGVLHWIAVGLFIGILPSLRPMLAASLESPGPFALNQGVFSFLFLLAVHLLFGVILGTAYGRSAKEHPEIFQSKNRKVPIVNQ